MLDGLEVPVQDQAAPLSGIWGKLAVVEWVHRDHHMLSQQAEWRD